MEQLVSREHMLYIHKGRVPHHPYTTIRVVVIVVQASPSPEKSFCKVVAAIPFDSGLLRPNRDTLLLNTRERTSCCLKGLFSPLMFQLASFIEKG